MFMVEAKEEPMSPEVRKKLKGHHFSCGTSLGPVGGVLQWRETERTEVNVFRQHERWWYVDYTHAHLKGMQTA